ncbi:hypothetical protein [Propioniciclava flava]|uniref:Uncharacterized protein n=1 Tax=Propioniciclava flava TaxID=2072026 RepID=A0A4Q2EIG5_9ACTN|nr:hypothetical protein [Propioniciclava flava]RXW32893.1 hypothetical protein C1706_03135 [Propioniciclava flava]
MTGSLNPDEARALLQQADGVAATARAGASWPHIAGLMGLGAASSLALVALSYIPPALMWLPLTLLFAWTGALFVFAWRFGRAVKRGFGRRWTLTLITWGALWVVAIFGTSWWFAGQTWFLIASAVALTVTAWVGAWAEASR